MYADPSKIRDRVIRVRLSEEEDDLLDAITRYTGQQKSTLMRELFMESAKRVLAGEGDIPSTSHLFEEPENAALRQRS
jgi:predicted DNA-binding protein